VPEAVLISGGAGFIGSHLGGELLGAGYRVPRAGARVNKATGYEPARWRDAVRLAAGRNVAGVRVA
jgi:uncharacterized protein YbjT (DUF2867 family)